MRALLLIAALVPMCTMAQSSAVDIQSECTLTKAAQPELEGWEPGSVIIKAIVSQEGMPLRVSVKETTTASERMQHAAMLAAKGSRFKADYGRPPEEVCYIVYSFPAK